MHPRPWLWVVVKRLGGEDELNRVISAFKDGGGEFDGRLDEINLNLSEELADNGSSQPRSPINAFPIEELYTPEFSESLQENIGYWQQPGPYEATTQTSPTKKKKATRNRQKRQVQTDDAPRQVAWTTEEEIALAKGWKSVSENSERGNARNKDGFWVEVMEYIESETKMEGRRTRVEPETKITFKRQCYQAETGLPFKFHHCWYVLKDSLKFQDIAFPNLNQGSQGSSKRHKSSGSSSFNTESGDASINLNNIVADDDEVQEIRRPGGSDKARAAAKNKGSKASESSTMNDDALAKLVVNELTTAEVEQREAFIELKRREVECREREIAATEYRAQQEDMKLYLQPYDHLIGEQRLAWDEIRAKIEAKDNLQF
ncbi:reverse transcriptase domain-containing protein [Tanacetum coccineum]